MNEKEVLKNLIDSSQKPNLSEWVYDVKVFLEAINESDIEGWALSNGTKKQGITFNCCEYLITLLNGIFASNLINVARYASLIWNKSLSKCNAQPAESNYQTHASVQAVFKEVQANE